MNFKNYSLHEAAEVVQSANESGYDEFASIFSELTEKTPVAPVAPAAAATAAAEAGGAPPAAKSDAPTSEGGAPATTATTDTEATPAEAVSGDASVVAAVPVVEKDYKKLYEEMQTRAVEAPVVAAAPAVVTPAPVAVAPPQLFTSAEQTELEAYRKEWPDVAKCEQLIRRGEQYALTQYIFDQVSSVYDGAIRSAIQRVNELEMDRHLSSIENVHEDYGQIHADVLAWVDTLPSYQRAGAKQVVESGKPADVIELLDSYKAAKGITAAAPATTTPAATVPATPAVQPTSLSSTARKAAAAMAAVPSKRSQTGSPVADDQDLESAWAQAITEK